MWGQRLCGCCHVVKAELQGFVFALVPGGTSNDIAFGGLPVIIESKVERDELP